jgi:hypothetical protein
MVNAPPRKKKYRWFKELRRLRNICEIPIDHGNTRQLQSRTSRLMEFIKRDYKLTEDQKKNSTIR